MYGIYKFGNNTYPRRIRCRSNLSHIFWGKKWVLWAGKYGIFIVICLHCCLWDTIWGPHWTRFIIKNIFLRCWCMTFQKICFFFWQIFFPVFLMALFISLSFIPPSHSLFFPSFSLPVSHIQFLPWHHIVSLPLSLYTQTHKVKTL